MADYKFVTSTGLVVPDTGAILTGVEDEYRGAFGQDLVTSPETPQGVLINAEAEGRDGVVRNNAEMANLFNPDYSYGVFLDAIWALTGGERKPATRSTVVARLTGIAGTVINQGAEASTDEGAVFYLDQGAIIGAGGYVDAVFKAVEVGPVPAPAGSLAQIRTAVLGWETINNTDAAVLGVLQESNMSARRRRRLTLALQGRQTPEAVQSLLADIDGYKSHTFRQNVEPTTQVIDGITLGPHSIYVCVDGGSDSDVAAALLESKGDGSGWNGAQEVSVVEPVSGQAYTVKFDRPGVINVIVRVTARFNGVDGQAIIPQAVSDYSNGLMEGEGGLTVGTGLSPFELAGAINRAEPRIFTSKVEFSLDGLVFSTDTVAAGLDQKINILTVQVLEL